jgi:hypothetical protein
LPKKLANQNKNIHLVLDLKLARKRNEPLEREIKIGVFRDNVCWYDNSYNFVLKFGSSLLNPPQYRMRGT